MRRSYREERVEDSTLDRHLLKRLLSYLKPYSYLISFSALLMIGAKALEAYAPILMGKTAQMILDYSNSTERGPNSQPDIGFYCIVITGVLALSYTFDAINVVMRSAIGQKALLHLRLQVYGHILKLPLKYFDHHAVGRLMTRTIHDVDQISQMFSESLIPILGNVVLFICMCIGVVWMDWKLGIALAFFLPIVFLVTNRFRASQRKCYHMIRSIVSAMNTFVQEHLMGFSTVRSFGLQQREKKHFEEINEDYCDTYMQSINHFAFFIAAIDFLQSLLLVMVLFILISFSSPSEGFQAGTFFTLSLYAAMFLRPLADLAERYNVLQAAFAAAVRIFHVLDEPVEEINQKGEILNTIEMIEFDDVYFAYEKDHYILKGLSFRLNKGESIAFVGETGAGKTSIMSLLLRFYEFQKGSIKINGISIRSYNLESLRSKFSTVLQDPVILSGTVADNIAFYRPAVTSEQIESAVDYMGMRSFIDRLPNGIQTELKERGKNISIGEMQLINMARAVAEDRSVIILDEATASVDLNTEKIIQEALKKLLENRTALVIAHRLSTIKDADRIIVLHEGRVAESGDHESLMRAKGIYEKLYRFQFSR